MGWFGPNSLSKKRVTAMAGACDLKSWPQALRKLSEDRVVEGVAHWLLQHAEDRSSLVNGGGGRVTIALFWKGGQKVGRTCKVVFRT